MAFGFLKKHYGTIGRCNQPQQDLFLLAEKRRWSTVIKLIQSNIDELRSPDDNDSFLHHVCKYQPPIEVITKIVNAAPALATLINFGGHSPLHIAARHGASPEVMCFLCLSYPDMSESQDINGRTPLHLACESYMKNYVKSHNNTTRRPAKKAFLLTLKVLIKSSPTTVNVEDINGMSASEYVLNGDEDIDLKVLKVIQRASVTEWERRRTLGEKLANSLAKEQCEEERSSFQQKIKTQGPKTTIIETLVFPSVC